LHESAWNLVGLLVVYYIGRHRKFDGQCFLFYFFWYGLGRAWIERLRTDSLYFFGLQIMGYPIRVSQMIAAVTCIVAGIAMVWMWRKPHDPADMYVNRLAARKAEQENSKEKEEE
jgi:phosphatidylglycerol:prolipoprotein diacylglycerol transferase